MDNLEKRLTGKTEKSKLQRSGNKKDKGVAQKKEAKPFDFLYEREKPKRLNKKRKAPAAAKKAEMPEPVWS